MTDQLKVAREHAVSIWERVDGDIDEFKDEFTNYITTNDDIYEYIVEQAIHRFVDETANSFFARIRRALWQQQPQRAIDLKKNKVRVGVMAKLQHRMYLDLNIIHGCPGKKMRDANRPELVKSGMFYMVTGGDYVFKGRVQLMCAQRLDNDVDLLGDKVTEKDVQKYLTIARATPIPVPALPSRRAG